MTKYYKANFCVENARFFMFYNIFFVFFCIYKRIITFVAKINIHIYEKTISFIGISLLLAACGKEAVEDNPYQPIILSEGQTRTVEKQNDLGLKLFAALEDMEGNEGDNYIFSPLSLNMLLSMAANANNDKMNEEIISLLSGENLEDLNNYNRLLLDKLPKLDKKSEITLSNAAFLRISDTNSQDKFVELLKRWYDSESYNVNESTIQKEVNSWISKKTKGLISVFDVDGSSALINSLYFKGLWDEPYTISEKASYFYNDNGTKSQPTFIIGEGFGAVFDKFSVYGDNFGNGHYQFIILTPNDGVELRSLLSSLTPGILEEIEGRLWGNYQIPYEVRMPKFTITSQHKLLTKVLNESGSSKIGDKILSDLNSIGIGCNDLVQKNYFNIDEKGVEVASVSGAIETAPNPNNSIIIDHPFIFLLRERSTGVILMAGAIRNL